MDISNDARQVISAWFGVAEKLQQHILNRDQLTKQIGELVVLRDKLERDMATALNVNKNRDEETVTLPDGRLLRVAYVGSVQPGVVLFSPRTYDASATE